MHTRAYYHKLRAVYTPRRPKLVIIAESPPASGKYFYDLTGRVTEPLLRAVMRDILGISPDSKEEGLTKFARAGFLLVDATYTPVNKSFAPKERNAKILKDYPLLVKDLKRLLPKRNTRILLIKANICRLLDTRLQADGFNVINRGVVVPFPAYGQQVRFREAVKALLGT
ncbi:MAG: hypothetical protein OEV49_03800 [candidate division Zixibacteria bacterium]|nr:hypothetical protein [candidate division Zixibacteria bacterium]MDH3936827.1 hypothetical protein [candidate division Zixibacteria bacterium]MDH4033128.1 hypothetical protein [candidate division Zixibacteria bacterium]